MKKLELIWGVAHCRYRFTARLPILSKSGRPLHELKAEDEVNSHGDVVEVRN
jgi:hypothetical protein